MEARIKTIMKAIRKPRNKANKLMVSAFERVPDKAAMPEYHAEIKTPMAMDILKRKLKRKKYQNVDHFMVDVELMFENAKQYNEEESQIYQDAVHLQKEARKIAKSEKDKPDTDFVMEEGRIPMPNGILHNGELWKVGDWVHVQNANDLTKPIVAQIYRTWQDADGGKWVNACWYYRPEQTVHRFDRHFLENEVVKTGQYRDHRIDEVVDRCFVMFVTRYNKGRPRDFPQDKEIYVCEARYNEENHKLNKIKTWASCLPDEVRDKDYVMDLFDAPRKLKKTPSPIAYMLKDDQKEDDELPKPEWGAENAPPKIGAVHRRPRDPKVRHSPCHLHITFANYIYRTHHLQNLPHLPHQRHLQRLQCLHRAYLQLHHTTSALETTPSRKHLLLRPCLLRRLSTTITRQPTRPLTILNTTLTLSHLRHTYNKPRKHPPTNLSRPTCPSTQCRTTKPRVSQVTHNNTLDLKPQATRCRSQSNASFSTITPTPAFRRRSASSSSATRRAACSSSLRRR
jgi:hypothetical protein